MDMRAPAVSPVAAPFAAVAFAIMTTAAPAVASARPIQNARFGRRRKNNHVPRPTNIGELFPKSVAVVAVVRMTAVL